MVTWAVVFVWAGVMLCLCMAVAIIYPLGWFLVPKPKYQRASSRRRPAEPDQLDTEIGRYRWLSFLIMYFFWFMLVIVALGHVPTPVLFWWQGLEQELEVKLEDLRKPSVASYPPITISAEGEVVFLQLRLPPEDHDLESLHIQLRQLAAPSNPHEPMLIRPAPETEHQRIIEVLSAVARAGIAEATLL